MYLEVSVLADTLDKLRRLRLPHRIKSWALTSLRHRLLKTGERLEKPASSDSGPDKPQRRQSERSVASKSVEVFWANVDDVRREASGRIVDASTDGFGLATADPLPVGHIVSLISPDCDQRRAIVRHCSQLADGWKSGVYWVKLERRRMDRWPVSGSATLTWSDGGKCHEAIVEMMDITESGARVDSPVAIPTEASCRISGQEFRCQGHISNRIPAPKDRYRLGLEFYCSPFSIPETVVTEQLETLRSEPLGPE